MLRKLQKIKIRKNKKLIQYRFNLKQLNINLESCNNCLYSLVCQSELVPGGLITLFDLCRQLRIGKYKIIYGSEKGLHSVKKFCKNDIETKNDS